jgi:ubiquinone/menaquinone biosynthesis C-methylase UbiE
MAFLRELDTCPPHLCAFLDNPLRRMLQNPLKILAPYVHAGQTVLDLGCGPGVFTIAMAQLVGESGKVVAVDFQQEMLEWTRKKAEKAGLSARIEFHKCEADRLGLNVKADFALAFYMVHEVKDKGRFFAEVASALKGGGRLLIVEPMFHVGAAEYEKTIEVAEAAGFIRSADAGVILSRSTLLALTRGTS